MLIAIYEEPLLEPVVPSEMGWTSARKQARAMLAATRDSLAREARMVVESHVLVWRGLCRVAAREHRDLLVVGSGHGAGDGQVRLGGRAQALLDGLECPLAIAPRGMSDHVEPRLERIGVGFDDGPEARVALELAGAIARAAGAALEVRGAVDDLGYGGLAAEEVVLGGEPISAGRRSSLLDRARASAEATGVPVRVDVCPGDPADVLCALGDDVDLLVIGSGRSGPAGRVGLGRAGRAVLRGCPSPVMIVPRPTNDPAL